LKNLKKLEKKKDAIHELLKNKNFDIALKEIDKVLRKNKEVYFYNLKGVVLINQKKYKLAIQALTNSVNLNSNFPDAFNMLGIAYLNIGNKQKAIEFYKKALAANNTYLQAHFNLASYYLNEKDGPKALSKAQEILNIDQKNILGIKFLANAHRLMNNMSDSIICREKILDLEETKENFYELGMDYINAGKVKEALETLKKSLPYTYSYNALTLHTPYDFTEDDILLIKNYWDYGDDMHQKIICGFSLSKIYEKKGDFKQSYEFLELANDLKSQTNPFNTENFSSLINTIKSSYLDFKHLSCNTEKSDVIPIFIVGLPRSGTSVVEQLISNHSNVYGGGEVDKLSKLFENILFKDHKPNIKKISEVRNKYIAIVKSLTDKKYFVDKTPINGIYSGLIRLVFPESKIIYITRDDFSTAFSVYQNNFLDHGLNYSYKQDYIVQFFKIFKEMMLHWNDMNFDSYEEIKYENLIDDYENQARKIFHFIGLDFNKNLLDLTSNEKPVFTVSTSQVRNGINREGIGKWRKYGSLIDNFREKISKI
tara:strand:+ start:329 stop:1945 length:1617 start_codon:yes stop_codon:yes gene_type:complete